MSTPQQTQQPSADDFLMGGGAPSAKFPAIGALVAGRIATQPTVEQQRDYTTGELKFWKDGNPMMQLVVTLATNDRSPEITDDDGTRRLYVKGQMKTAIQQAVKTAGARGLEVGGVLTVRYVSDGPQDNPRFSPPKQFTAHFAPAAQVEMQTGQQPAAPAPQQGVPAVHGQPLTPQQAAAAQQNPATAALYAQQQVAPQDPPF